MATPDWDKGLPIELLADVASHSGGEPVMRAVCKSWQQGFDTQAARIRLQSNSALRPLQPLGPLSERFHSLTSLDIGSSQTAPSSLQLLRGNLKLSILVLGSRNPPKWREPETLASQLADSDLQHLRGLPLSDLNLKGCTGLTEDGLGMLSELPLTRLHLARCFKATELKFLDGLPLLRDSSSPYLFAATDAAVTRLASMPLTSLCLNSVADQPFLAHLRGVPLTHLGIRGAFPYHEGGVECLKEMPNLTSLNLSWTDHDFFDEALEELQGLSLKKLRIAHFCQMEGYALAYFSGSPLTELSLKGNFSLCDDGLEHLRGLPLAVLDLGGCTALTMRGVAHLRGIPLTSLSLSGCKDLPNSALSFLQKLPLTHLSLNGCQKLTDTSLGWLRKLPLRVLDVRGCRLLTPEGIETLRDRLEQECQIESDASPDELMWRDRRGEEFFKYYPCCMTDYHFNHIPNARQSSVLRRVSKDLLAAFS